MNKKTFLSAIFAGICISLGCIVFLNVGGIVGAILFSFGLLSVVSYKLYLFTGKAGFIPTDCNTLLTTLGGNIVGCLLMTFLMTYANDGFLDGCCAIYEKRMALMPYQALILSTLCGLIMTTAVEFAKDEKYLPLLFGVPLFIMSGYLHSIADCFYILGASAVQPKIIGSLDTYIYYGIIVFGNYIGCNIYRLFICMNYKKKTNC